MGEEIQKAGMCSFISTLCVMMKKLNFIQCTGKPAEDFNQAQMESIRVIKSKFELEVRKDLLKLESLNELLYCNNSGGCDKSKISYIISHHIISPHIISGESLNQMHFKVSNTLVRDAAFWVRLFKLKYCFYHLLTLQIWTICFIV